MRQNKPHDHRKYGVKCDVEDLFFNLDEASMRKYGSAPKIGSGGVTKHADNAIRR